MKKSDKKALLLMLSDEGKEVARRLREVKSKKVKTLTRAATFKVLHVAD